MRYLILIPWLLTGCATTSRVEPQNAQNLITKADRELNNPAFAFCPPEALKSLDAAKIAMADAQKELDKLKDELTTLEKQAAKAETLEKELLKKDKRIWQLWTILIGTGALVGFGILMKLGLFAAKFRPFFLI